MSYPQASFAQYFYNIYAKNNSKTAVWAGAGTCDTAANTRVLISEEATFITDLVAVGDTVKLTVGTETATVVEVVSESMLFTTALSGAGSYAHDEVGTVKRGATLISSFTVAATNPATIVLIDTDADFIGQGVMEGDTVTMTVGSETAAVQKVYSAFLVTATLSGAGTYAAAEAFTIANGSVIRAYLPDTSAENFIKQISGKSDNAAANVRIYNGYLLAGLQYTQVVGSTLFEIHPALQPVDSAVYVEMDITTAGSLNVSYENRA